MENYDSNTMFTIWVIYRLFNEYINIEWFIKHVYVAFIAYVWQEVEILKFGSLP